MTEGMQASGGQDRRSFLWGALAAAVAGAALLPETAVAAQRVFTAITAPDSGTTYPPGQNVSITVRVSSTVSGSHVVNVYQLPNTTTPVFTSPAFQVVAGVESEITIQVTIVASTNYIISAEPVNTTGLQITRQGVSIAGTAD